MTSQVVDIWHRHLCDLVDCQSHQDHSTNAIEDMNIQQPQPQTLGNVYSLSALCCSELLNSSTVENIIALYRPQWRVGSLPNGTKLRNNLGQVVHTYVPRAVWYWSKDGDVLRLER